MVRKTKQLRFNTKQHHPILTRAGRGAAIDIDIDILYLVCRLKKTARG